MLADIERTVQQTAAETGLSALDPAVADALRTVPRHEFVPKELTGAAYINRPLPIGEGQTISQPYIVALMTQLVDVEPGARVLEIGTGSGYQAAVLAELGATVYTIEIVEPLGRRAAAVLERLCYDDVHVRIGDGYAGWPEHAPFDAVVVTAAPETIPQPLIDQLATGGRLVIPVGPRGGVQQLQLLERQENGEVRTRRVLPVSFVPFTRDPAD
ncbi:MAG: protein-L-isoaspartate(D-aspartate) O-methyltransferase [Pseudomonadota bacterium]